MFPGFRAVDSVRNPDRTRSIQYSNASAISYDLTDEFLGWYCHYLSGRLLRFSHILAIPRCHSSHVASVITGY